MHLHTAPLDPVPTSPWVGHARRWWPAFTGAAFGGLLLADAAPWRAGDLTTFLLPGLAVLYLVIGSVRHRFADRRVLAAEVGGLVLFGAVAVVATAVAPASGRLVLAAGFVAHALWDIAHHRDLVRTAATGVVPRGYAEWCFVVDLFIAVSLVVTPAA